MSKKAPWFPALLASGVWLLARGMTALPIGAVDSPTPGQSVFGVVQVRGFVLDFNRVDKIEIVVDNGVPRRAEINLPRADVLEAFPNYANSATPNPGFLSSFNVRFLSAGPHQLKVLVTETDTATPFVLVTLTVFADPIQNQAPFGYIDIPSPAGIEGANGSFPVAGWTVHAAGLVDHIDFLVDGQIVAGAVGTGLPSTAVYGTTRPDIFAAFPDVPNSLNSGFAANIDTTKLLNGMHVFSVRVYDNTGASRSIGTRTVQVINNSSYLAPFGWVDFPLDKASIICSLPDPLIPPPGGPCPSPCFPPGPGGQQTPVSFYKNIVSGWALDVAPRLPRGSVDYVELLLDGAIIANTQRDCVQAFNILANCYGVNRPDVARSFSGYPNADNSGFVFMFALQQDLATGLFAIRTPGPLGQKLTAGFTSSGKHTISIRAGNQSVVTTFASFSVDVLCDTSTLFDQPPFGYVDTPYQYQFLKGVFTFSGWAFDFDNGAQASNINGVTQIDIDIDGQVVGRLFPPYLSRPDVPANDFRVPVTLTGTPSFPTAFVGWQFTFDTGRLSDTEHDLVIYAWDTANPTIGRLARRVEIGRRKFVVFNNTSTKP